MWKTHLAKISNIFYIRYPLAFPSGSEPTIKRQFQLEQHIAHSPLSKTIALLQIVLFINTSYLFMDYNNARLQPFSMEK